MKSRSELTLEALVPLSRQKRRFTSEISVHGEFAGVEFDKLGRPTSMVVPAVPESTKKNHHTQKARTLRMHALLKARHTNVKPWVKYREAVSRLAIEAYEDAAIYGVYWPREVGEASVNKALLYYNEVVWGDVSRCQSAYHTAGAFICLTVATRFSQDLDAVGVPVIDQLQPLAERLLQDETEEQKLETMIQLDRLLKLDEDFKKSQIPIPGQAKPPNYKDVWPGSVRPGMDGWVKGDGLEMGVYDLPKNTPCSNVVPNRKLMRRPYGNRLNFGKLPSFISDFDSSKLFIARKDLGTDFRGTILIDASGSMGAEPQRLQALCRAIPSATVSYYSSGIGPLHRTHRHCQGSLVIYAHKGMRLSDDMRCPYHGGGNDVDAAALEWLLLQKAPYVLVSDREFDGGWSGQARRAHDIVRNNPQITIIESISQAWLKLCGQPEPSVS